jgi:2-polyprenyl-3-methyl-5-hydroxy-6-metoxy-1,4-benzoquinol methylase
VNSTNQQLTFTGERFLPNEAGEMWAEHWHRYHAIQHLVAGKRVLDVACGEGYGSALLSNTAAEVSGVDISNEAIAHATAAYSSQKNLTFFAASCTQLPFADHSFDVVVSFETIEHITEHDAFLNEIKRVLTADGLLIISSPNKAEYSDARNFQNEFHVGELYRDELAALIAKRFAHTSWFSQRNGFYSLITPCSNPSTGAASQALLSGDARIITVSKTAPQQSAAPLPALYFLVLASANVATIEHAVIGTSAFCDAEEFAMNDYKKIYRDLVSLSQKHQTLHDEMAALQREHARLREQPSPKQINTDSWFTKFIKRLTT